MEGGQTMNMIQVKSKMVPVVELDPETHAVYIRFSNCKVVKTIDDSIGRSIVTIDIDSKGNVVGVELIGIKKFSISRAVKLLSKRIENIPDLANASICASCAQ